MNRNILAGFFVFACSFFCYAQEKDAYDKKYDWRIRQETLYGVYIPKDVNEAIVQLNRLTDEQSKAKFKSVPEEEVAGKLFFSLGRWMTHNWGLFEGSRLSVNMQSMGIYHPDDMTEFIIVVFHRSLNQKPLEIKALVDEYHQKYEQQKKNRIEGGTIIHEETRQVKKQEGGN